MQTMSLLNRIEIAIKWTDLDPYNHLNNSKYFDFMTEARSRIFYECTQKNKTQLIIHECNIVFKKPYYYPNNIIIEQFVENVSGASFELKYIFKSPQSDNIEHAEAKVKMVSFDPEKNRVCRIPQEYLKILNQSI
ncbi:acyl-CoA thioesterase [Fluviispira vulneris]|uniref:acyl-CoA thioesterase n=1 Tax=Fluviispira vulneris TaxID=2763012 RepID=UPI0016491F61|nr:thioesterase family protein [Fluviispira vulneris]